MDPLLAYHMNFPAQCHLVIVSGMQTSLSSKLSRIQVVSRLAVPGSIPLHMSTGPKSKNNPNKHFDGGVGVVAPILKRIHNPDK